INAPLPLIQSARDVNAADATPSLPSPLPENLLELESPSPLPENLPELESLDIIPTLLPGKRIRRTPRHLIDFLPSDPRPLQQFSTEYSRLEEVRMSKRRRAEEVPEPSIPSSPIQQPLAELLETEPNEMGLFRRYRVLPSQDPDEDITIYHVADAPTFVHEILEGQALDPLAAFGPTAKEIGAQSDESTSHFFPFLNASVFRLMSWFYSSKKLTLATLDRLVQSVILAPDFQPQHFEGFSAMQENRRLDDLHVSDTSINSLLPSWFSSDKWRKGSVKLPLPLTHKSYRSESNAPTLKIDFYHRDFVEVLKSGIQDYAAKKFHWHGFQLFWKPSENEPEQRVYGEAYTSDYFLKLEETIIPVEGCNLEIAVIPLMLYSDSTQLANFGTAALWPLYMWFGSISKYIRGKTTSFSAHHIAYLPSLPDLVKDKYNELFGMLPTPAILTFLRRELIQAVWKHLLTQEFKKIYKEGIILKCGDGNTRRLYPRFFTYSADYKERVLIAGIKDMGTWLDVTCTIMTSQVLKLGTKLHDLTWSSKLRLDSIQQQSSIKKARKMIFEQGYAVNGKPIDRVLGESLVPVENAFSQVLLPHGQNYFDLFVRDIMHEFELGIPPFGRDTIRKFHSDVSAMKSMAARDFEDLVQVAAPCFEKLFLKTSRTTDSKIHDLLFVSACWHASAKMRLHTEWSLKIFRGITKIFTQQIRIFSNKVCPLFDTQETPKEATASTRQQASQAAKKAGGPSTSKLKTKKEKDTAISTQVLQKKRTFNIDTPKMHSIFENQIAQHERREARSRAMEQAINDVVEEEELPETNPEDHHYISRIKHTPINFLKWAKDHEDDPATKNFVSKLRDHLVTCLVLNTTKITDEDRSQLIIRNNMIYEHKTLRINYTTYDNRREQDTINPSRHSDVMFLADEEDHNAHPYWYFRVVKIFHALARLKTGQEFQRIEFLWGRWYGFDYEVQSGFPVKRMHQIGFMNGDDAFGFANPSDVLRAVHLIPCFGGPRIDYLLGPSMARRIDEENLDYERYYVN
ncbi:hypothetical protein C0992_006502, partial [Termitomyces sp. T32_za158]